MFVKATRKTAALGSHAGIRMDPRSGVCCDDVAVKRCVLHFADGLHFYVVS